MSVRIAILACLLGISYGSIEWVKSGYNYTVEKPDFDLERISLEIGDWLGEDSAIRDDTVRVLDADQFINRVYTDDLGRKITFHAANWANEKEVGQTTPHHPQICYPAAGWEIISRARKSMQVDDTTYPVEMMLLQKSGQSLVIAHWFELGDRRFVASDEGVAALCALWGKPTWPSVTKFLAQTTARSIEEGEASLIPFCRKVRQSLETTKVLPVQ